MGVSPQFLESMGKASVIAGAILLAVALLSKKLGKL